VIIRFPTGLYKTILPKETESGNITYLISSEDPPRPTIRAIQLPLSEELRPLPTNLFDQTTRRSGFGELVFTIAQANRDIPGSNQKQFELGERLEFEESPPLEDLLPILSPDKLEIRHDTNILDLTDLGLTDQEIDEIVSASEAKQSALEKEFTIKKKEIDNISTGIVENQKVLNETVKAIGAVRQIFDIPENDLNFNNDIYQKLLIKQEELESERDSLISDRNVAVTELRNVYNSLLKISELVR